MIKRKAVLSSLSLLTVVLLLFTSCLIVSADTMADTDGRVTDSDGFLGDTDSPESLTTIETDKPTEHESTTKKETVKVPEATETSPANDADGVGILGVIITLVVIAAVVIIVVTLLPKKRT